MKDFVYTALFGEYEMLNELRINKEPSTEYVCFTDDEHLRSETWDIRLVKNLESETPVRKSREIKILGYKLFPQDSRTLYLDNTVQLKVDGSIILNESLDGSNVSFMHHYSRKSVRGEFVVVAAFKLDNQHIIDNQFNYYKENYSQVLDQKPYWGGLIARRNSHSADLFSSAWKSQYDLFSRRDQLSINAASLISGVEIAVIPGKNDESNWHKWPIYNQRKKEMREIGGEKSFRKARIFCRAARYSAKYFL